MIQRPKLIALLTFFVAALLTASAYKICLVLWPPELMAEGHAPVSMNPADAEYCFKAHILSFFGGNDAEKRWLQCQEYLDTHHALDGFEIRNAIVLLLATLALLALFAFALAARVHIQSPKLVRGPRLLTGEAAARAFNRASKMECQLHGTGIDLPDGLLSRDRESRHFLVLGSIGGGKTQTMLHLILGAMRRGDAVLVLDTKGDMTASLPARIHPLLLAPHDQRSMMWDIAADCRVKQDARELATRFIPPSVDPMWSQAAQELFVACVAYLQDTLGLRWTWRDLDRVVTSGVASLAEHAARYNPNALRMLDQPDSRTTLSVLVTFQTHMRNVAMLSDAWGSKPMALSIRQWLENPSDVGPVILQHDPGHAELSRTWISAMLNFLASAVGSPSFPESRDRRIWLFLDEFPQLPAIQNFPTFLELGRSKGVCVVIGAQDIAQIRATYGANQAKSWFSMVGTKIITRINTSETAEEISRLIGNQEIERKVSSTTHADGRSSTTWSIHREIRPVITPSELGTRLGPTKAGVRALMLGLGEAVYELDFPYISLPRLRQPNCPARWTTAPPIRTVNGEEKPETRLDKDIAEQIWNLRLR